MTAQTVQPTQPAFRPFAVRVAARTPLSPSFVRFTLAGHDLDELAHGGADQRVKLLFPLPGTRRPELPDGPDWYQAWRALPADARSPMRTYTVRAARPERREVDVDVVLHGATGPASAWAEAAGVGDELVLVGPNARFDGVPGGVEWRPPAGTRTVLLAGDETAVPAIASIAESLPPSTAASVVLEVPTADDVLALDVHPGVDVVWLPRHDRGHEHPHGVLLEAAVRSATRHLGGSSAHVHDVALDPDGTVWEVPSDAAVSAGVHVWLAGEAGVVVRLRRYLLDDVGLDRRAVAFMGYWRRGRPEAS